MLKFKTVRGRRVMGGFVKFRDKKDGQLKVIRTFHGITTFDGYWWEERQNKWVKTEEHVDGTGASSHFGPCNSVRAFRRRLRQWGKYLPKGVTFILSSRIDDYCVEGKIT